MDLGGASILFIMSPPRGWEIVGCVFSYNPAAPLGLLPD